MTTVVIQIGNSDDKLTQVRWAHFIECVDIAVRRSALEIHFSGTSNPTAIWQNAAWIFDIDEMQSLVLYDEMKKYCAMFNQDSIAWTEGKTIFCKPTL